MNRSRTILHVDDDPSVLRLVSSRLTEQGFNVVSVDDPACVSDVLLETGARVVLLDIDMPQTDGLEALKAIKEQDGGIQVIMLTGLVAMSSLLQAMHGGAEACVFKPIVNFTSLLTAIDAAYNKLDRWWQSLDELSHRRLTESHRAAVEQCVEK